MKYLTTAFKSHKDKRQTLKLEKTKDVMTIQCGAWTGSWLKKDINRKLMKPAQNYCTNLNFFV